MLDSERLRTTLSDLEGQLRDAETYAAKLRQAIDGLRGLLPAEKTASPAPAPLRTSGLDGILPPLMPSPPVAEATSIGDEPPGGRPKLRDAIPMLLREKPEGMNLARIAQELWSRGWVGGKDGNPSVESVRQVMLALARNGITESHAVPNEKAPVWRLSNVMLPRPPAYTPEEEAQGI